MDDIFDDLITEGVVVVYLDDILIFTETLEEHQKVTRRVMEFVMTLTDSVFTDLISNSR